MRHGRKAKLAPRHVVLRLFRGLGGCRVRRHRLAACVTEQAGYETQAILCESGDPQKEQGDERRMEMPRVREGSRAARRYLP